MIRSAPQEFTQFGCDPAHFRKVGRNEYHGPCPMCGGRDRFAIFTDRDYPHWNAWCRVCHPDSMWIDELNPMLKEPLSPEKAQEIKRNAERRFRKAQQEMEAAIDEMKRGEKWLQYHDNLDNSVRRQWESWGIPEFWQDFYKLGYDPDRVIYSGGSEWHTPTMTIPIFEAKTWECLNIKHRLLNPPRKGDKYRPERSGLPAPLFVGYPDAPITGKTLLVEGEKKAMVSYLTADDDWLQVVGIPGKNPTDEMLSQLDKCDPLYICLDPDARTEAIQMARQMGVGRSRLIELPDKIDDMIVNYSLGKSWMQNIMRQGVKVK